ncbi:hypothetical protein ACFQ1E_08095 [Sphingomonas canadensis]|uniref:Uncharacterized protein n=1 Tax=Sphingomonas canadensis TaxID=1219257 RepID=A0ABW3H819_9SPHN|nr:hypothetical protein [Sphingomonas canadensis]MCW3835997.1 hypothetical protein [Sphingomonas canadensis]
MSMRDAYRKVIDAAPRRLRRGIAIYFAVRALDHVAKNSMLPAQARYAKEVADIARPFVPAEVTDLFREAGAE